METNHRIAAGEGGSPDVRKPSGDPVSEGPSAPPLPEVPLPAFSLPTYRIPDVPIPHYTPPAVVPASAVPGAPPLVPPSPAVPAIDSPILARVESRLAARRMCVEMALNNAIVRAGRQLAERLAGKAPKVPLR